MIVNSAICIQTAGTWTRVLTSLANACLIARTIGWDDTFRATIRRCADIIDHTRARRVTVDIATLRIASAWGRYTRVHGRAW